MNGRQQGERLLAFVPDALRPRLCAALTAALDAAPDPDSALTHLSRFVEAAGTPLAVLEYLADDPATLEALLTVLGGSHFAARTLALHPEYLELLTDRHRLATPKGLVKLQAEADTALSPFRTLPSKLDALRRFRRRETVRLIAADLLGLMDVPTVTAELSALAEAVINAVVALIAPDRCRVLVVAFGKLGAGELNYSSDIDLVLFHEGDSAVAERWARKVVTALSEVTDYGRLYRVDLRLRPYGATAPLTLALDAAFAYYEAHAEPSERLALLKARAIAGDPQIAQRFEQFRHAFVFGSPLEAEELAWLLRVKARSEAAFATDGAVKHGLGGIRDVEMTVQFLQLAFAHRFPDLAVRDTLTALERLQHHELLTAGEAHALRDSYLFLRRLEHMLQIAEDLPLQTLPSDERELNRLARCMGMAKGDALLCAFTRCTQTVRQIYEAVTAELAKALGVSESTMLALHIASGLETDTRSLSAYGFTQPQDARRRLARLVHGEATAGLPWRERVAVMRVLPSVLDALAQTPDPDTALMRLENLIAALGPRHAVLDSLSSNPLALRALALVACFSEPLCQLVQRYPEVLESWLAGVTPALPDVAQWRALVRAAVVADPTQLPRTLRRLKGRWAVHLGFLHLSRLANGDAIGRALAHLADALVDAAVNALTQPIALRLAVLALGGWGSGELHFGSDLDCVFAHTGDQLLADKTVRRLRALLGDLTDEGVAYRLDLRLRPTGQEGALTSDWAAWQEFAGHRFEAWMALAWTRLRWAAGDRCIGDAVTAAVTQRLYERPLSDAEWAELRHLLERIRTEHRPPAQVVDLKHSDGALWDIELQVAERQLRDGCIDPLLRTPSTLQALQRLAEREMPWQSALRVYRWLRELRLWLSWMHPDAPPRFVLGDRAEKLLAWLDSNPAPLTQTDLVPVDDAVDRFRQRWRQRSPLP
ncbi:Bifunctional glutamine synthetase adenylyltransferase/adenylyl-removing enzyme [bacterium HR17]|uniref:Bifunctional glutamine synthetase adenylyltransferase/adenylyl-removing enzyme n=1 Tax=Candidatus Fervidibacter japonicus TaxID=2035412 RepID=A0A2H5XEF7_9BACT|nr:Bifunctional glutamine synthetase adenylyltransferase/adenylyl-removing enzyme [bacterium HR17]